MRISHPVPNERNRTRLSSAGEQGGPEGNGPQLRYCHQRRTGRGSGAGAGGGAAGGRVRTNATRISTPQPEHRNLWRRSAGSRGAPPQAGQRSRTRGRRLFVLTASPFTARARSLSRPQAPSGQLPSPLRRPRRPRRLLATTASACASTSPAACPAIIAPDRYNCLPRRHTARRRGQTDIRTLMSPPTTVRGHLGRFSVDFRARHRHPMVHWAA